ncbi:MAG: amino acid adenylation domain-containing protein, partial [Candidatus Electrothrix sp. MAN1_4]|nr:amino acid adenylation domain-containing protein [Candidatus Electrothrix sp. MAN1_4]
FAENDSAAPLLLTQSCLKARLPLDESEAECVFLDKVDLTEFPGDNPAVRRRAEDLAYVIYTSGSTGRPKGAMNAHAGIVNRLLWMQEAYQLTYEDRILQKTPFSFDVSVWEFFWPLLTGASLIVAKPKGHKDPVYLASLIAAQKVTTLHFVPSMLHAFVNQVDTKQCRSLKRVICSGEALSLELMQQFFTRFSEVTTELHNLYGPTEAAVDVSYWPCQSQAHYGSVPIGKPVANTRLYVLDAHYQIVPVGVPGELHIGGIQVGCGYLNRPELTAEKFIEVELFNKIERIYKTGDLARWLPDGNLEYLGRMDHQVKLRGFRIELGEIEAALTQYPAVKEVVVTLYEADDNTCAEQSRSKRLAAYLTADSESDDIAAELREHLQAGLPDYMLPSSFTVLD